jgi:SOS response regulatory protein OraA/RecX
MTPKSYNAALKILGRTFQSEYMLRQKLRMKSFSEEDVDNTCQILLEEKLLDDAKMVQYYKEKEERKEFSKSKYYLFCFCLKKGIDNSIIEEVLENYDDRKHLCNYKILLEKDEYEKVLQRLVMRGFRQDDIYDILKNI